MTSKTTPTQSVQCQIFSAERAPVPSFRGINTGLTRCLHETSPNPYRKSRTSPTKLIIPAAPSPWFSFFLGYPLTHLVTPCWRWGSHSESQRSFPSATQTPPPGPALVPPHQDGVTFCLQHSQCLPDALPLPSISLTRSLHGACGQTQATGKLAVPWPCIKALSASAPAQHRPSPPGLLSARPFPTPCSP